MSSPQFAQKIRSTLSYRFGVDGIHPKLGRVFLSFFAFLGLASGRFSKKPSAAAAKVKISMIARKAKNKQTGAKKQTSKTVEAIILHLSAQQARLGIHPRSIRW